MAALRRLAGGGALCVLALAMVAGTAEVAAQTDEEFEKIYPFIGIWDSHMSSPGGQDRGNCGGRTGDYGEKLLNCSLPADQLVLNARGEAWMNYMDLRQSPTTVECADISIPTMLIDLVAISASPGRVVLDYGLSRTIWMDGAGPTPRPGELFQHGHSVGHFDGSDLVVETTKFTFDPEGMDDHLHMASSVRKKITERYQLIDDDNMRLIVTMDDPTFLEKPFTYAILKTRTSTGRNPEWRACDPDLARRELEYAYPGNKYLDEQ